MDYKKDIQSEYETSQGQNSPSHTSDSLNTLKNKGLFLAELIKKTEKLVAALYMVTDFMDSSEPLRSHIRLLGTECIAMLGYLKEDFDNKGQNHQRLCALLEELSSYIRIAKTVGLISQMNGSILEKEIELFGKHLIVRKEMLTQEGFDSGVSPFILSESIYPEPNVEPAPNGEIRRYKGHVLYNGHNDMSFINETPKTTLKNISDKVQKPKLDIGIKLMRRNNIIALIKDKKEVTIKDIAHFFKDLSEKTIQRELSSLVVEGVLNKKGKKRWSKYSITL